MVGDREDRAELKVSYNALVERLERLELHFGQDRTNTRPWFAEQLNNEIADLRALQARDI